MAQFSVYLNRNPVTNAGIPLLLDVQSDLLSALNTTVVVPLYATATMKGAVLGTLTPEISLDGERYVMVTPQLAGIMRKELGPEIASLAFQRDQIVAALDLLIFGV